MPPDLHPNSSFSALLLPLSSWAILWHSSENAVPTIGYLGSCAVTELFALYYDWFTVLLLMLLFFLFSSVTPLRASLYQPWRLNNTLSSSIHTLYLFAK